MSETQPRRRGRPAGDGREAILTATGEILRERGIARLTTREVAARAGVSEASVFYHYGDRAKLLQAAFDRGLAPLLAIAEGEISGPNRRQVLDRIGRGIERFLGEAMPILTAAQSDAGLRDELAAMMAERDLGPHRGVSKIGDYLATEQEAGRVRGDIDPHAVAASFVGTCVMRAFQATMQLPTRQLPPLSAVIDALDVMLEPPA